MPFEKKAALVRVTPLAFLAGAMLLSSSSITFAQQPTKVPDSVTALAGKYDGTRKNTLGPILDAFVGELKTKTVPALTRAGKADIAIQIDATAEALAGFATPVLPREGAPFSKEALAALKEAPEWQAFADQFTTAEATLNEAYKTALDREKSKFQTAGDPHGVLAVESESKRIDALSKGGWVAQVAMATPAPAAAPAATLSLAESKRKVSSADKKLIESYFVGKTWAIVFQGEPGKGEFLYFAKDGTGARKTSWDVKPTYGLRWTMEEDGTVFVVGAGFSKHSNFLGPEAAKVVVHFPPPEGDIHYDLKVSSETIPAAE